MTYRLILSGVLVAASAVAGCTDDTPLCTADGLRDALAAATSGETIHVGACSITGSFVVPEGVSLSGAGRGSTEIVAMDDEPAIRLLPGESATRVEDLDVTSGERVAVLAMGSGRAALARVGVTATRGIAFGAESLSELTMEEVELSGPVTSATATSVSPDATYEDTAIIGAIVTAVDSATLTDVTASGFASYGFVSVATNFTWSGGGAPRNLGTGLLVHGGSADLRGLSLGENLAGLMPLPVAGVFASGATVETSDLQVDASEGLGLLHDNVTVHHTDLIASDNADVALWVQRCPSFELSGSLSELVGNRFSAIALFDTVETVISGARIDETAEGVKIDGELGTITVGDGVQAVTPGSTLVLRDLELSGNQRVGVLVDLTESEATLALEDVVVDGTGDSLGVVAQGRTAVDGWDDGVTRSGATEENDQAITEPLPTIGARYTDDDPSAMIILDQGVAGIIGDCGYQ